MKKNYESNKEMSLKKIHKEFILVKKLIGEKMHGYPVYKLFQNY